MADYICPYICSYRTNAGFCGYTGGQDSCAYRKITGFDSETHRFYAEPVATRELVYSNIKNNYDRLTHMSMEELAVMLAWPYLASPPWCSKHTTCPYINEDQTPCNKCVLDWLKQEVNDDP